MSEAKPTISVVIPSGTAERDSSLEKLIEDARSQDYSPLEIEVVRGISPNGNARNQGITRTRGDILIFLDDDVRLGSQNVFSTLVSALQQPGVGLVGTSQLLPLDSTPFQKRCAEQIARSQSTLVEKLTDSDMVTTQCCAIRRDLLEKIGGFHPRILRGVDPELRHRVRKAGYRIAIAPKVWHYHPMPQTLQALCRLAWRNGHASSFAQQKFPETVLFNPEGHVSEFNAKPSLLTRLLRRTRELTEHFWRGSLYGIIYDLSYTMGYIQQRLRG